MFVRKAMTCLLGWLLVLWSAVAFAAPPGGQLNITQVFVVDQNNPTSIMIIGEGLLFGPQGPTVTLGEFGDLEIVGTPTDTMIEASLPAFIQAGDYLLTVAGGNGPSQNDKYDLTIGAVGPPGPAAEDSSCPCEQFYQTAILKYFGFGGNTIPSPNVACFADIDTAEAQYELTLEPVTGEFLYLDLDLLALSGSGTDTQLSSCYASFSARTDTGTIQAFSRSVEDFGNDLYDECRDIIIDFCGSDP